MKTAAEVETEFRAIAERLATLEAQREADRRVLEAILPELEKHGLILQRSKALARGVR